MGSISNTSSDPSSNSGPGSISNPISDPSSDPSANSGSGSGFDPTSNPSSDPSTDPGFGSTSGPGSGSTSDPNPVASVDNNLTFDVDIYDAFLPDNDPHGLVKYTLLTTVPANSTGTQVQTINPGSHLLAVRTGNISALNNDYYVRFPVAVLAVVSSWGPNSFVIDSDMQQSMEDSFKFIKYTQANPDSQSATDFDTALGDQKDQETAVNNFFLGTGSFKKCTFDSWTEAMTWQTQFTSPWQGTYYLYSLGSSATGTAPALVATLTIVSSAQNDTATLTMASPSTISTAIVVIGNGSMQESNPGPNNLSVILTPSWIDTPQTNQSNGTAVVSDVIGAAFAGTISGAKVAGNLNKLTVTTDPKTNPKDSKNQIGAVMDTVNNIENVVGTLASVGMLYLMAKQHRQAEMQKENVAAESARNAPQDASMRAPVRQAYQQNEAPWVRTQVQQARNGPIREVQPGYQRLRQSNDIQNQTASIQSLETTTTNILGHEPASSSTNAIINSINKSRNDVSAELDPGTSSTIIDNLINDSNNNLSNANEGLKTEAVKVQSRLTTQEQQEVTNGQEDVREMQEQSKSAEEAEAAREQQDKAKSDQKVSEKDFDKSEPERPIVRGGE